MMIKNNNYTDYKYGKFLVNKFNIGGSDNNKEVTNLEEKNEEVDSKKNNEEKNEEDKFKKTIRYINDTNQDVLSIVDKTDEVNTRRQYYEFKNMKNEDEEKKHVNKSFMSFFGFKL